MILLLSVDSLTYDFNISNFVRKRTEGKSKHTMTHRDTEKEEIESASRIKQTIKTDYFQAK